MYRVLVIFGGRGVSRRLRQGSDKWQRAAEKLTFWQSCWTISRKIMQSCAHCACIFLYDEIYLKRSRLVSFCGEMIFCTLLGNFKNSQRGSFGEEKLFWTPQDFAGGHGGAFRAVFTIAQRVEPGDRAKDADNRRNKAQVFTKDKLIKFLNQWIKPCLCEYDKM
jgi:hypothetical protein